MIWPKIEDPAGKTTELDATVSPSSSGHVSEVNTVSSKKKMEQNSPVTAVVPDSKVAPACPKDCFSMLLVAMIVGC